MPTCQYCLSQKFKTEADVSRHQSTAAYCSEQLRREDERRLAALNPHTYEDSDSDPEIGEEDYFHLIRGSSPLPDDFFGEPPPPPLPSPPPVRAATPPLDAAEAISEAPSEPEISDDETLVQDFPGAGRVIDTTIPPLVQLFSVHQKADNPYAPFASKEDWDLSRWAKLHPVTDSALNELLGIQGVRGGMSSSYKTAKELNKLIDSLPRHTEFRHSTIRVDGHPDEYDLFACNPLDVLRELVADPTFEDNIVFGAQRCFEARPFSIRRLYGWGQDWYPVGKDVIVRWEPLGYPVGAAEGSGGSR